MPSGAAKTDTILIDDNQTAGQVLFGYFAKDAQESLQSVFNCRRPDA